MERSDVVAAAINEALVVDHSAQTRSSLLYETYLQWHARSDRTDEAISQTRFSQALERKGFRRQKRTDGNYIIGLKPKSALRLAEEEADD
jgi:phage/plasmid-associated DNA primase